MSKTVFENPSDRKAYIITGPTSGIGRCTALELANYGMIVLVGRDRGKLNELQKIIEQKGQRAVSVVCDLSEPMSVRRAAAEIIMLKLPIAGLVNNAGIMQTRPTKNSLGWDMSFATNHLGPFMFTEALVPYLLDGASVVFIASAVENPEHKPAKTFGFRGGRYISAEASVRGEWKPGGSKMPGADAYATSKQCNLASVIVFAHEIPRLHFNAVEPGVNVTTSLGVRDAGAFMRFVAKFILPLLVPLLMPFIKVISTPKRAAKVITKVVIDESDKTGIYYDEHGQPMLGSEFVRDPKFAERVVIETRAFLSAIPSDTVRSPSNHLQKLSP